MQEPTYSQNPDDIISESDIAAAAEYNSGADIAKLFLEDEFVNDLISGDTKIFYDAIKKLGVGQYSRADVEKILRWVDAMKTTFIMSSMEYGYTWEHEREFTIFKVIAFKNTSMGVEGTFLKRAFGSIQETSLVQTLNSPAQQKRPGLIASMFSKNK